MRPDYDGGSLVNLMASVAGAVGARPTPGDRGEPVAELRCLPAGALGDGRRIAMVLVDGLGDAQLAAANPAGALRAHRVGGMTSVFPSTTAAAITTVMTGVAPRRHGLTGWHVRLAALDLIATPLPYRVRGGGDLRDHGVEPATVFGAAPLTATLGVECHVVQPRYLLGSTYSAFHGAGAVSHGADSIDACLDRVATLLCAPGERYVYAYWPQLDALSHRYGAGSREARRHLRAIDDAFARLTERLRGSGATAVLTADHGFVDTTVHSRLLLDDLPELAATLRAPLCGEPRVAFCYLRPGAEADFLALVADRLAGRCTAIHRDEMLEPGWLGPGPAHPDLAGRVGDWSLLMRDDFALMDTPPGDGPAPVLIGVHGGATPAEMEVPVVVARG
ncbi:MAG: alkaline phosphatase family protein [Ectothiorhodospiraceae bacterium]|nr:alkaline phosphatase family protein [Chromatiales bacterium]MCP5157547.1 alkaline phosphatase family protein [Ectothiorhodospiraceae bacterium]